MCIYIYITWPFSFITYLHKLGKPVCDLSFYIWTVLQIRQGCRKLLLILCRDLWQIGTGTCSFIVLFNNA